jgi:hypothetical protein
MAAAFPTQSQISAGFDAFDGIVDRGIGSMIKMGEGAAQVTSVVHKAIANLDLIRGLLGNDPETLSKATMTSTSASLASKAATNVNAAAEFLGQGQVFPVDTSVLEATSLRALYASVQTARNQIIAAHQGLQKDFAYPGDLQRYMSNAMSHMTPSQRDQFNFMKTADHPGGTSSHIGSKRVRTTKSIARSLCVPLLRDLNRVVGADGLHSAAPSRTHLHMRHGVAATSFGNAGAGFNASGEANAGAATADDLAAYSALTGSVSSSPVTINMQSVESRIITQDATVAASIGSLAITGTITVAQGASSFTVSKPMGVIIPDGVVLRRSSKTRKRVRGTVAVRINVQCTTVLNTATVIPDCSLAVTVWTTEADIETGLTAPLAGNWFSSSVVTPTQELNATIAPGTPGAGGYVGLVASVPFDVLLPEHGGFFITYQLAPGCPLSLLDATAATPWGYGPVVIGNAALHSGGISKTTNSDDTTLVANYMFNSRGELTAGIIKAGRESGYEWGTLSRPISTYGEQALSPYFAYDPKARRVVAAEGIADLAHYLESAEGELRKFWREFADLMNNFLDMRGMIPDTFTDFVILQRYPTNRFASFSAFCEWIEYTVISTSAWAKRASD